MERTRLALRTAAVVAVAAIAALGWLTPFAALLSGAAISYTLGKPAGADAAARLLLAVSVVALGCGVDLVEMLRLGCEGFQATLLMLAMTFGCGWLLRRRLQLRSDVALLITAGTAICGGSAIAAVAPLIRARPGDIAAAASVVFAFNAVALLVFPAIGTGLGMTETCFGEWCALAIHDTSSVVGAASSYGPRALELATITKLGRMLWIVPVGLMIAASRPKPAIDGGRRCPAPPWFLVAFLLVAALGVLTPALRPVGRTIASYAPNGMTLALLAVGLGLRGNLRGVLDLRSVLFGLALWLVLAATALLYVHGAP